jgi:hypothetical protein
VRVILPTFSLSFILCSALCACSLDSRDLQAFQLSASGPEKLCAVLGASQRAAPLRAEAALALLDLTRADVDGRSLLFSELTRLDAAGKRAILPSFKSGLSERMKTEEGQDPSADALRAKDAGTKLLPLLDSSERTALGAELLAFIALDVPRRADRGELTLEQIAHSVGPASAQALTMALSEKHDSDSLARLSAIIDQYAQGYERARAGQRMVALELSFRANAPGADSRGRQRVLASLGRFADQSEVRTRLLGIAASDRIAQDERVQALELLQGHVGEAEIKPLLALAQAESAPPELRVLALSRVGETKSKTALPAFLILLTDRNHHALRRLAGELSLGVGGSEAVGSFFRNLPTGWGISYEKAEIDSYVEPLSKLPPDVSLLMLLGEKIHSSFWWNRVLALRYFAQRGTAEDVWRIRQHVHDILPITGAGYPQGHTVGLEAESALALAIERLHATSAR